jgi:hypothetical protein
VTCSQSLLVELVQDAVQQYRGFRSCCMS